MTRLLTNSSLLSKMGEYNIYYINKYIYILYLGLKNTTSNNQNFISNKKIYTLIFWSGNSGNSGNKPNKPLKLQQSLVPTFSVFNSHYSHFPFCIVKLTPLFFKDFFKKPKYYHNAYFLCSFTLISIVINKSQQYHRNDDLELITLSCIKPPDTGMCFKNYLCFFGL